MADKIKVSEDNKYPVLGLHRDEKMIHMYSLGEIRILTPNEYHKLRAAIPKERHKILLDILMITGMRYIEVQRLWDNPKWYNEESLTMSHYQVKTSSLDHIKPNILFAAKSMTAN